MIISCQNQLNIFVCSNPGIGNYLKTWSIFKQKNTMPKYGLEIGCFITTYNVFLGEYLQHTYQLGSEKFISHRYDSKNALYIRVHPRFEQKIPHPTKGAAFNPD